MWHVTRNIATRVFNIRCIHLQKKKKNKNSFPIFISFIHTRVLLKFLYVFSLFFCCIILISQSKIVETNKLHTFVGCSFSSFYGFFFAASCINCTEEKEKKKNKNTCGFKMLKLKLLSSSKVKI